MEAMNEQQAEKYESAMWDFELKLKDLATEARREDLPELAACIETCAGACHGVWRTLWDQLQRAQGLPIAEDLAKGVLCQRQ
jgi:hypothetical protein